VVENKILRDWFLSYLSTEHQLHPMTSVSRKSNPKVKRSIQRGHMDWLSLDWSFPNNIWQ